MSLQYYDFTLVSGQVRSFDVFGDYVYYLEGSAGGEDLTIELKPGMGGDTILLKPGQGYRLEAGQQVGGWSMKGRVGAGQVVGVLQMGTGNFTDNRVTGEVSVVDAGRSRSVNKTSYVLSNRAPAVAAQNSWLQLRPGGTATKMLIVWRLWVTSSVAGIVQLRRNDTALAGTDGGGKTNKKFEIGIVQPTTQFKYGSNAVMGGDLMMEFTLEANKTFLIEFKDPVILLPGAGLVINGPVNAELAANVEVANEAIS